MNGDEQACPDCAETIKAAAKVCKHCGYRFPEHPSSGREQEVATQPQEASSSDMSSSGEQPGWFERAFDVEPAGQKGCTWAVFLIVSLLAFALYTCTSNDTPKVEQVGESPTAKEQSDGSKAIDVMVDAKNNVVAAVKDSDSAKFRNLFVSNSGGSLWALCGLVNSKNSFGGYTGYKRFVAFAHPDAPVIIDGEATGMGRDMDKKLYPEAEKRFCSKIVKAF